MKQPKVSYFSPLLLYSTYLGLSDKTRTSLCTLIDEDFIKRSNADCTNSWTGDVNGASNLHLLPAYNELFQKIGISVQDYARKLGIATSKLDFYFTRSWGVRQEGSQEVQEHTHNQSNISVVYYPCVPKGANRINFHLDNPNEFCPGLFSDIEHISKGLVDGRAPHSRSVNTVLVDSDLLLVFPSKTPHSVPKNLEGGVRYSFSSDIICTLNSREIDYEVLTPSLKNWSNCNAYKLTT